MSGVEDPAEDVLVNKAQLPQSARNNLVVHLAEAFAKDNGDFERA
jgi:hypothetical protein